MKMKKILCVVISLFAMSMMVSCGSHKQQLAVEEFAKMDKAWIMYVFGYGGYSQNYGMNGDSDKDFYEEEFLNDENLPMLLVRFKKRMDDDYPDIGYGRKYEKITIERLKTNYREIVKGIEALDEEFRTNYSDNERVYHIIVGERVRMRENGIWIGDGAEKVDENSEVALARKVKAGCMAFLGIGRYENNYIFNGYKEEVFEKFLKDEGLPLFLEHMKTYMDEHYPEIGYGNQYEEITVERLKTDYEGVYKETEEIRSKVKDAGDGWGDIRLEILRQAGIEDE